MFVREYMYISEFIWGGGGVYMHTHIYMYIYT